MKKSFTIIYTVIASLIIIFAISFFGVNIYNEKQHGDLRTQVRFEKMAQSVFTSIKKPNISSSELTRQIENAIGDTKDFSYIKISSKGKTLYLYPADYSDLDGAQSNLILRYTKSDVENIQVIAGLYTLRPGTIFNYAKISFFIILIVALITIILILFTNQFGNESIVSKNKNNVPKIRHMQKYETDIDDEEDSDEEVNKADADEEDIKETSTVKEDSVKVQEEIVAEQKKEETSGKTESEKEPEKAEAEHKPAELPVQDFEPVELQEAQQEQGLFSQDTGLGWESYLMTRLDNELNRATASELDLSLFIIKINGITRKNPLMKKICDYLIVEFQFKDLLFEYKDDSICALKISMNIDNAITFGEKLEQEIKTLAEEENISVYIGITSRGIRMVSGERLLKEADEAVIHAQDDSGCTVVGFRADAAKYRKFLESQ